MWIFDRIVLENGTDDFYCVAMVGTDLGVAIYLSSFNERGYRVTSVCKLQDGP